MSVPDKSALELVTVAVQYCSYLEQCTDKTRKEFTDTILKLSSLLYLKTLLVPPYASLTDDYTPEAFVTSTDYDIIRGNIAAVMAEKDDYLDVFVEDMKYSDTPILCTISENLTDVYQDVKNFALNYRNAASDYDSMQALAQMKEDFRYYWGQKLVNVMRALHEVSTNENEEEDLY